MQYANHGLHPQQPHPQHPQPAASPQQQQQQTQQNQTQPPQHIHYTKTPNGIAASGGSNGYTEGEDFAISVQQER